jgi:hypothetical protein
MTTAVDNWPAYARLLAVASAGQLPTPPTPLGGTQPKVLPDQHRGAPCQRRDCRCVGSEKSFASRTLPVSAITASRSRSGSAVTRWRSMCGASPLWELLTGSDGAGRCHVGGAAVQPTLCGPRAAAPEAGLVADPRRAATSRGHLAAALGGISDWATGGYGYSRFCDLYREWRAGASPTMRQTHVAGEPDGAADGSRLRGSSREPMKGFCKKGMAGYGSICRTRSC